MTSKTSNRIPFFSPCKPEELVLACLSHENIRLRKNHERDTIMCSLAKDGGLKPLARLDYTTVKELNKKNYITLLSDKETYILTSYGKKAIQKLPGAAKILAMVAVFGSDIGDKRLPSVESMEAWLQTTN